MNFALIGAAGYVAPRHMKAMKDVGGNLVACLDPHDSVGILDSFFPGCKYFSEFERFERHCHNLKASGQGVDYVSIASQNYLHDAHCRFALRIGAHAICEKPLVLYYRNIRQLKGMEKASGKRIYPVLQLRNHPQAQDIKYACLGKRHTRMSVTYHTPRGAWYDYSWKADQSKSGGIATNIGIHLFDLASWCLGRMIDPPNVREYSGNRLISGNIWFERGSLDFTLSTMPEWKPERRFKLDSGEIFQFDTGFTDLHTEVYRNILSGAGCSIEDASESIRIVEALRYGVANGRSALCA